MEIIPSLDGNYLIHGGWTITPERGVFYRKFNGQGEPIWERILNADIVTHKNSSYINNLSDSTYIAFGINNPDIAGASRPYRPKIVKLDQDGNTIWETMLLFPGDNRSIFFNKSIPLDNGNFIFAGTMVTTSNPSVSVSIIGEISGSGDFLWSNELPSSWQIEYIKENGNVIFSHPVSFNVLLRHESDAQGNLIHTDSIPAPPSYDNYILKEEAVYLLTYLEPFNGDTNTIILEKLDAEFNSVAKDSIFSSEEIEIQGFKLLDDKLAITGFSSFNIFDEEEFVKGYFLVADSEDLEVNFIKSYGRYHRSHHLIDLIKSDQPRYIVAGGVHPEAVIGPSQIGFETNEMSQTYVFKTDLEGNIYNNNISGIIFQE